MEFLSIQAENFLSFKKLDYLLPRVGLHFVGGRVVDGTMSISNGAGKSAVFEALAWGLFGKTIRHTEKAEDRDKVVNRIIGENCFVEVILEDDDKNACVARRYRSHKKWQNALRLFKGEDEITGSSVDETQKTIDSILGMNWLVFSSAVVFGEKAKRFIDAADAKKKEVFDEIMMFHPYLLAQQEVKEDLKKLLNSIETIKVELQMNTVQQSEAAEELEGAQKSFSELVIEKEGIQKRVSEYEIKLCKINDNLEVVKKERELAEIELVDLEEKRKEIYEHIEQLRKDETLEMDAFRKITAEAQKKAMPISIEIEKIQKWLDSKDRLPKGERCPTCKVVISDQSIEDVTKHYESELKKLNPQHEELKTIHQKALEKEGEIKRKWETKLKETERTHSELMLKLDDQKDRVRKVEREAQDYATSATICAKEIEHLKGGTKEREDLILQLKKRAERKVAECKEKEKTLGNKIRGAEDESKYLKFWVEGFSGKGIKSLLLDEILPQLNTLADYYGSVLLDNQIRMEFDTESELKSGETRDKFNIKLFTESEEIDYRSCSQGEKGRIDSAVLLALQNLIFRRSNCASSLVIFDEVFEHLDSVGIERMVNLLKEEAKDKAIFVISHQNEFADYFDNVIMVEKENGESRLVQQ